MAATFTETLGIIERVQGFMEDENIKTELAEKGFDVSSQIESLNCLLIFSVLALPCNFRDWRRRDWNRRVSRHCGEFSWHSANLPDGDWRSYGRCQ